MPAGPPPAITQRVCNVSTTDYTDSTDKETGMANFDFCIRVIRVIRG